MKTITTKPIEVKGDNLFSNQDWALFDEQKYAQSKGIPLKKCPRCSQDMARMIPSYMDECPHCYLHLQASFVEMMESFCDETDRLEEEFEDEFYDRDLDENWHEKGSYDIA